MHYSGKASIHNVYKWGCAYSFSTLNADFYITQQWLQRSADTYHLRWRQSTSYYSRDLLLRLSLHVSFFRSSARCTPSDFSHLIQLPYLSLSTTLPVLSSINYHTLVLFYQYRLLYLPLSATLPLSFCSLSVCVLHPRLSVCSLSSTYISPFLPYLLTTLL